MNEEPIRRRKELKKRPLVDFGKAKSARFLDYECGKCNEGHMLADFLIELYDIADHEKAQPISNTDADFGVKVKKIKESKIQKFLSLFFNELNWCRDNEAFITLESFIEEIERILLYRKQDGTGNPFVKLHKNNFFDAVIFELFDPKADPKEAKQRASKALRGYESLEKYGSWVDFDFAYFMKLPLTNGFDFDQVESLIYQHAIPERIWKDETFLERLSSNNYLSQFLAARLKTVNEFLDILKSKGITVSRDYVEKKAKKLHHKFMPDKRGRPPRSKNLI